MTLFKNLILFTNHYRNLPEMLEMASFLKYVDLYLTSEWGRFYVGHPVLVAIAGLLAIRNSLADKPTGHELSSISGTRISFTSESILIYVEHRWFLVKGCEGMAAT
jgi:hypothetical protein